MKSIVFRRKGRKVSDFEINELLDRFLTTDEWNFLSVSNYLIIEEVRARIAEGKINPDDINVFVEDFNGKAHRFIIDGNGRSFDWVDSQDIYGDILSRILSNRISKRKRQLNDTSNTSNSGS